jgi:hypothetical protein
LPIYWQSSFFVDDSYQENVIIFPRSFYLLSELIDFPGQILCQ